MISVALVPGVIGFDRFGPLHYFNGVAQHLEDAFPGATVRELTTDPIGTVADRAEVLAREIVRAFGASGPIHIVAHSMGGLDARFLVSQNVGGVAGRVKTVVGISTPHRGSPVASVFDAATPLGLLPRLGPLASELFDDLRARTNAVHDLSEAGAAALDVQ
jgi:triacylglycerol lipase